MDDAFPLALLAGGVLVMVLLALACEVWRHRRQPPASLVPRKEEDVYVLAGSSDLSSSSAQGPAGGV
jgi:hypothetical protein